MGPMVWRVLGTGSAVLAGVVANKLVTTIWKKAGRDAVVDPRDPRTPWKDAVAFAALTGLAAGAAKVVATRKAAAVLREVGRSPAQGDAAGRRLTVRRSGGQVEGARDGHAGAVGQVHVRRRVEHGEVGPGPDGDAADVVAAQ